MAKPRDPKLRLIRPPSEVLRGGKEDTPGAQFNRDLKRRKTIEFLKNERLKGNERMGDDWGRGYKAWKTPKNRTA